MPRTRVVVQSRMTSSRLPGKAMLSIAGMPLVELVARRVANTGHEVVVATSRERLDDHIVEHLTAVGVPVMRGSLDDVLARFVAATEDLAPTDRVVRMTGDNPVADGTLVDELGSAVEASGHTYGRVDIDQVPEGIGCEVFTVQNLRDAEAAASAAYDREHVTPWLRRRFGELLWAPAGVPTDVHAYRATVDSLADYDRVARLFHRHEDPVAVSFRDLLADVVGTVDALGPQVARDAAGQPGVVLDLSERADTPEDQRREVLRRASDRGADMVVVDVADTRSLRLCADSSLRSRLAVVLRLAAGDGPLEVERALARLGGRSAAGLLVPDDLTGPSRDVLDAYAADGTVRWVRPTGQVAATRLAQWSSQALDEALDEAASSGTPGHISLGSEVIPRSSL